MTGHDDETMSTVPAITDHVRPSDRNRYEALVGELHQMLRDQPGFLSVDTVRHVQPHRIEYTILLRFAGKAGAQAWRSVPGIAAKLADIRAITGEAVQIVEAAGLEIWVDHARGAEPGLPPFWKRVALSVIAVYPMLMLLLFLSQPLVGSLPRPIQVFTIVVVLSALLTWPIMPYLSRLLRPWLFGNASK